MRNRGRGATTAPVMVHINGRSVGALLLRKMRPMARSSPTRHNRRGCPCWRGPSIQACRKTMSDGTSMMCSFNCRPGFAFFNSPACAALRASSIAVARACRLRRSAGSPEGGGLGHRVNSTRSSPGMAHFVFFDEDTVIQLNSIGPMGPELRQPKRRYYSIQPLQRPANRLSPGTPPRDRLPPEAPPPVR
jgi:hypothetical protein